MSQQTAYLEIHLEKTLLVQLD